MTKVMRKEARHTQRRDRASGVPLEILEHIILPIFYHYVINGKRSFPLSTLQSTWLTEQSHREQIRTKNGNHVCDKISIYFFRDARQKMLE